MDRGITGPLIDFVSSPWALLGPNGAHKTNARLYSLRLSKKTNIFRFILLVYVTNMNMNIFVFYENEGVLCSRSHVFF